MRKILTLLFGLVLTSQAAQADNLSFCYDPYPPYTLGEEGPATGGMKVALLDAVMAQIDGVSATVTLLPWKRCQAVVRAGEMDGILPLFSNDERREYLAMSQETIDQVAAFWHRKGQFDDEFDWSGDYAELSHLQLGMLNGSYIDAEMEAAFEAQSEITRARDVPTLLELLMLGRIDVVAIDASVGRYVVARQDLQDDLVQIDRPISSKMSYFGLSKASGADRHLEEFNRAIATLQENGALSAIVNADY
ncbi:MAG: transporter substrate-binding domain-containing protein [Pseudomonadota bacterium]